jgi:beta subunit of N-acylethanolamine-hydrolyzing acid amidase
MSAEAKKWPKSNIRIVEEEDESKGGGSDDDNDDESTLTWDDEEAVLTLSSKLSEQGERVTWQRNLASSSSSSSSPSSSSTSSTSSSSNSSKFESNPSQGVRVPRYSVSLNEPPSTRWNHIVDEYREQMRAADRAVSAMIRDGAGGRVKGKIVENLASGMLRTYNAFGGVYYGAELQGIANRLGVALGKLVLMNIVYNLSAYCSAVVVEVDGVPVHIRTMDWDLDVLEPLTVEIDFVLDNRVLFSATTWVGCVGVFTGVKPNCFSSSINFRISDGTILQNVKRGLGRSWPVSFLMREVLESAQSYEQAVAFLANSHVMAPCYIVVAGTKAGEGAVLTRERSSDIVERRITLADRLGGNNDDDKSSRRRAFIVQTNQDHWDFDERNDIMWSMERRELAAATLSSLGADACVNDLWRLMRQPPILNELTIYTTLMIPARDGYLQTQLNNGEATSE